MDVSTMSVRMGHSDADEAIRLRQENERLRAQLGEARAQLADAQAEARAEAEKARDLGDKLCAAVDALRDICRISEPEHLIEFISDFASRALRRCV
jgi:regulator of protease activity HflC (stomatin/prohibitin superfamily)